MRKMPLDFVQFDYSIAERDAEKILLPLAQERHIAVLANLPFVHGSLIRKAGTHPCRRGPQSWGLAVGRSSFSSTWHRTRGDLRHSRFDERCAP